MGVYWSISKKMFECAYAKATGDFLCDLKVKLHLIILYHQCKSFTRILNIFFNCLQPLKSCLSSFVYMEYENFDSQPWTGLHFTFSYEQ